MPAAATLRVCLLVALTFSWFLPVAPTIPSVLGGAATDTRAVLSATVAHGVPVVRCLVNDNWHSTLRTEASNALPTPQPTPAPEQPTATTTHRGPLRDCLPVVPRPPPLG